MYAWNGATLFAIPLAVTHQAFIMISYIALGHPGGGGRRYPPSMSLMA